MAQSEEWGPWVSHDGLGCPVEAGTIVEVLFRDRFGYENKLIGLAKGGMHTSWHWSQYPRLKKIVRYRVKKPKGMEMLREVMEDLPQNAPKEKEPA